MNREELLEHIREELKPLFKLMKPTSQRREIDLLHKKAEDIVDMLQGFDVLIVDDVEQELVLNEEPEQFENESND